MGMGVEVFSTLAILLRTDSSKVCNLYTQANEAVLKREH
jgi:hypothetical protein